MGLHCALVPAFQFGNRRVFLRAQRFQLCFQVGCQPIDFGVLFSDLAVPEPKLRFQLSGQLGDFGALFGRLPVRTSFRRKCQCNTSDFRKNYQQGKNEFSKRYQYSTSDFSTKYQRGKKYRSPGRSNAAPSFLPSFLPSWLP
jgi:hypothetical protein